MIIGLILIVLSIILLTGAFMYLDEGSTFHVSILTIGGIISMIIGSFILLKETVG